MRGAAVLVVLVAMLAGCAGSGPAAAEDVVRGWSSAVNAGDNTAAGALFAPGAKVVQGGLLVLRSERDAIAWNTRLSCSGTITSVAPVGDEVVDATFLLGDRGGVRCRGAGERVRVVFSVRGGKIEVFHQLLQPPPYASPA